MKYYWILKYIFYCTYTRKNLVAAYYEGGAFSFLILSPVSAFLLIMDKWNSILALIICGTALAIDWTITWDDDKVIAKYNYLDENKWKMEKEVLIMDIKKH